MFSRTSTGSEGYRRCLVGDESLCSISRGRRSGTQHLQYLVACYTRWVLVTAGLRLSTFCCWYCHKCSQNNECTVEFIMLTWPHQPSSRDTLTACKSCTFCFPMTFWLVFKGSK
jgi:hypothetical protein